ncbi:MAG: AsmA-like C-terminal domain-containing protein [Magnetococcales bacterium]|nr:AsmA-like C-terminal domain-containing protein [Magnetococcales bacterium]
MMADQPDTLPPQPVPSAPIKVGKSHFFWHFLLWAERVQLTLSYGALLMVGAAVFFVYTYGIEVTHQSPYVSAALSRLTGWHWLSGSLGAVAEGSTLRLWVKDLSLARSAQDPPVLHSKFATCTMSPLAWLRQEPLFPELRTQDLSIRIPRPSDVSSLPAKHDRGQGKYHDLQKVLEGFFLVMGMFRDTFPVGQMVLDNVSIRMGGADATQETEIVRIQDWVLKLERELTRTKALKADGHIAWHDRLTVINMVGIPDAQGVWQLRSRIHGAGLSLLTPLFPELVAWEADRIGGNISVDARFDPQQGMDLKASALVSHAHGKIPVRMSGQLLDNGLWHLEAGLTGLRLSDFRAHLAGAFPAGELTSPLTIKTELQGGRDVPTTATWRLEAGSGSLGWKPLFRWPFPVSRFLAQGTLKENKTGLWQLVVSRFHMRNSQGEARGDFSLKGLGGPDPLLDLRAEASGVATDQANFFYPVAIMPRDLVDWLDHSLKNGRVTRATARILGPVAQIPFPDEKAARKNGWIFRIEGDVVGADIQFYPALPPVSKVTTHLLFDRLSLLATVTDGVLARSNQVRGQVAIPNMLINPMVIIDATTQADLKSMWQDLIAHPRLRWDEALGLVGLQVSGSGPARLKISLPLDHLDQTRLSASVDLADTFLKLPFLESPIEKLAGRLTLDSSQLKLTADSGEFYQMPIQGTLEVTDYHDPAKTNLQLDVKGHARGKMVQEALQPLLDLSKNSFLPDTPFQLELSRLPKDTRFHFNGRLDTDSWAVSGRHGWEKMAKDPGHALGIGYFEPGQKSLVFQRLIGHLGNLSFAGAGAYQVVTRSGHLAMDHLQLGETMGNLKLFRNTTATGDNPEWKVEMAWDFLDLRPVLKWIELPESSAREEKIKGEKSRQPVELWPRLHLSGFARRVTLAQGETARDMEVGLRMQPEGYTFDRLLFNQDAAMQRLEQGEFRWQQKPGSGPYSGRFRLTSDNLGSLLKGLDRHQGMQGGKAVLNLNLAGTVPTGGRSLLHHLSGKGEIESQKGVVHRLHLMASLLGLLSLPDLPNLIVGDRPDLAGTGFYYEKMQGNFTLKNGLWHSDQWALTGPSMKIVASGDINLVTRQLDMLVGIQPLQTIDRIINRVPILGKLVSGSREAIVETLFQVSGPWSDPVTRIKPVDSLAPGIVRDLIDLPGKLLEMALPKAEPPPETEGGSKVESVETESGGTAKSSAEATPVPEKNPLDQGGSVAGGDLVTGKKALLGERPPPALLSTEVNSPPKPSPKKRPAREGGFSPALPTEANSPPKPSPRKKPARGDGSFLEKRPASKENGTVKRFLGAE